MIKTLQNVLASVNVITAIAYPLLNFNQSVLVRVAGVSCGVVAVLLSRGGIFQPIIDLNSQRWRLKKEVKSLGSQISFLERKLKETTTAKEEEFKKREQALTEKEENLNQQLQEAAAAKEAQLNEREQALVEAEKELEEQIKAANEELDADKEKFLKEQEAVISQYQSKIDLLESDIDELRSPEAGTPCHRS